MGEAEPSYPTVTADWQTRHGRRHRLHCLGNTRSIVPPGQSNASASAISMRMPTYRNECEGRWTSIWRPRASYTCRPRTTLRRGVGTFPWRGVQLLCGGSGTLRGVRDPAGVRTLREVRSPGCLSACLSWDTWRPRTFPGRGTGPVYCRKDRTSDRRGPAVWLWSGMTTKALA